MSRAWILFSIVVSSLLAQVAATPVEGEVVDSGGQPVSNVSVALCRTDVCEAQAPVYQGRFRFVTAPSGGVYTLRVIADNGATIHTQSVYLDGAQAPIRVTVSDPAAKSRSAAGSVSIARLSHRPPKAASRELERALSSFKHNRPAEGTEHLEKALSADPQFADAHYLLGLRLEANGDNADALKHLEDAAPSFPKAHIFAAKILSRTGKKTLALRHLRQYVLSGDAMYRDKALFAIRASGEAEGGTP